MKFVTLIIAFAFLGTPAFAQSDQKIQNESIKINYGESSQFLSEKNIKKSDGGLEAAEGEGEILSEIINVPLQKITPFLGISTIFFGNNLDKNSFAFYVRGSEDGSNWEDWYQVNVNEDAEPNPDEKFGILVFLKKETRYIQYKIEANSSFQMEGIELIFISPGTTSALTLEKIKEKEPKINFTPDLSTHQQNKTTGTYPRPSFVTRTEWGCPEGQGALSPNSITIPTHLIVHHSAGPNSSSDWPAIVRSYYALHTQNNGWSDIGYNWLIDANGVVYQGRAWRDGNDNVRGAHFCGTNSNTMGVCVMGTFTSVNATEAARRTLVEVLSYKASEQNIDPKGISFHSASGLTINNISGHRDGVCSTECPGTTLWNHLPVIRNRVHALLNPPNAITLEADSVTESSAKLSGLANPLGSQTAIYFQWGKDSLTNTISLTSSANGDSLFEFSVSLDSLEAFTNYQYRIAASNSDTISYGNIVWFNTTDQLPAIPNLNFPEDNAQNIPTELLFDWSTALGAFGYTLQVSEDSLFAHLIIDEEVIDTFFVSTHLNDLTKYWWKVSAKNQNGESEFADSRTFTTILNLPQQVQLYSPLDSVIFMTDSVSLVWESSSPQVNFYWLELSTNVDFSSSEIDSTITDTIKVFAQLESGEYWWRIKAKNLSGWGEFSSERYFKINTTTSVDHLTNNLPQNFELFQNFPNPFNPTTKIKVSLPEKSHIKLKIFNLLGKEIAFLKNGILDAGYHEFSWNASGFPSGIYFYQFEYQTKEKKIISLTKKLILLK